MIARVIEDFAASALMAFNRRRAVLQKLGYLCVEAEDLERLLPAGPVDLLPALLVDVM